MVGLNRTEQTFLVVFLILNGQGVYHRIILPKRIKFAKNGINVFLIYWFSYIFHTLIYIFYHLIQFICLFSF